MNLKIVLKSLKTLLPLLTVICGLISGECPSDDTHLTPWSPASAPDQSIIIGPTDFFRLDTSAQFDSIVIDGGAIVFNDGPDVEITLTVRHIEIKDSGQLHIGSEACPYRGRAEIILKGKSTDMSPAHPAFGRKFIGVAEGGTLEIHGQHKQSWTELAYPLHPGMEDRVITLMDDVTSWNVGDMIIVASTDYSMDQAERFRMHVCDECQSNQIKISNSGGLYTHYSGVYHGVEMRAEVINLDRNIKISGEMEDSCYGDNYCEYFDFDNFGGHIMVIKGFTAVHISNVQVFHMGQQAFLARYPIHFHVVGDVDEEGGYMNPTYVKNVSIHNSFNRCLTIHGTNGLLVENTVGYETFGHCFFMEDGAERRNTLINNVAMVTRASTLLPTDRDAEMCAAIRDKVWPGYVPKAEECTAVSGFWIAHPENILINNRAAGAEETGFWYIFYPDPTGPSAGTLPHLHGVLSPPGVFKNNKAHSNKVLDYPLTLISAKNGFCSGLEKCPFADQEKSIFESLPLELLAHSVIPVFGLIVGDAVQTGQPTHRIQSEYLSRVVNTYGYWPHENNSATSPREQAVFENFVAYKNNLGAKVRGGELVIANSAFLDNGVGVTLLSDKALPMDDGSHQEVVNSMFVGESDNRGTQDGRVVWGVGADGLERSVPMARDYPVRGFDVVEGPSVVRDCIFYNYQSFENRTLYAIGFQPDAQSKASTMNTAIGLTFLESDKLYSGEPGGWYGSLEAIGDKMAILHDEDGSLTGYAESYIMKPENWLTRHAGCDVNDEMNAAICRGNYATVFLGMANERELLVVRDEHPMFPVTMTSVSTHHRGLGIHGYNHFIQPNVYLGKSYTIHWADGPPPMFVTILPAMFNRGDYVIIGLCYPLDSIFGVIRAVDGHEPDAIIEILKPVSSLAEVEASPNGALFYWDQDTGLLFVKLVAHYDREGEYYHCSLEGCEKLWIFAKFDSTQEPSNCYDAAYPEYAKSDIVGMTVPEL